MTHTTNCFQYTGLKILQISLKQIYKPRGIYIIVHPKMRSSIISKGVDSHGIGRWFWVTMTSKENHKVTIVTVYKVSNVNIESVGIETLISQQ